MSGPSSVVPNRSVVFLPSFTTERGTARVKQRSVRASRITLLGSFTLDALRVASRLQATGNFSLKLGGKDEAPRSPRVFGPKRV